MLSDFALRVTGTHSAEPLDTRIQGTKLRHEVPPFIRIEGEIICKTLRKSSTSTSSYLYYFRSQATVNSMNTLVSKKFGHLLNSRHSIFWAHV